MTGWVSFLVVVKVANRWGLEDGGSEGQRNSILQKAISLYVGQMGLKYDKAMVVLSSVKEKGKLDQESYSMVRKCCCYSLSKNFCS